MLIIKTIIQLIPFIRESMGKGEHNRHRKLVVMVLFLLIVMSGGTILMGQAMVTIYNDKIECIRNLEGERAKVELLEGKIKTLEERLEELDELNDRQEGELNLCRVLCQSRYAQPPLEQSPLEAYGESQ